MATEAPKIKKSQKTQIPNWSHQALLGLTEAKPHRIDKCLYLRVERTGHKRWVFRWRDKVTGKLRDMGCGSFPDVLMADAKAEAVELRKAVRAGLDPIAERRKARADLKAAAGDIPSFKEACKKYIDAHEAGWKNDKHISQWRNTLKTYCDPINALPVNMVEDSHIIQILDGLWYEKTETASRLRGRIEKVLDWAAARKYREGSNPARWRGHLETMFPAPSKLKKVKHHASLPYAQAYDFMNTLKSHGRVSARALRFLILTACRTSEITGARWNEIDLDKKVWSIPADRMKSKRPHRVALNDDAIEILEQQAGQDDVFVFPGARDGSPISAGAMPELIKELRPDVTCHGMRSSFRTWAAERPSFPREIAETALAHTNRDRVESAYLHSDHLEKRFLLMAEWAKHCNSKPTKATVTSLASKLKI